MAGEPESSSNTIGAAKEISAYNTEQVKLSENEPDERHIFLCYKSRELWPDLSSNALPNLLAYGLASTNLKVKTSLTIFEKGAGYEDGDVLLFPENVMYRGLKNAIVARFVRDVHANVDPVYLFGEQMLLLGYYIFVWGDDNMFENIKKRIEAKGLQGPVRVIACCPVEPERDEGEVSIFLASCSDAGYHRGNWFPPLDTDQTLKLLDKRLAKIEAKKLNGSGSDSGSSGSDVSSDEPEDMALG